MAEKSVRCPFNPEHKMLESMLQRHIIKCMVNYPEYLSCPYNALHRFKNKTLLLRHKLNCPSKNEVKALLDWSTQQTTSDINIQSPVNVENTRNFNLAYEDWDEEMKSGNKQQQKVSKSA
ncbi:hypothetical protein WA026_009479 [Henosepilachna vigintioctopunctata]|uniref:CHHC U11-48K-type domain-containing protein n=1 Tax=Henosepilachna vigintioctopunctata TaxID=420089 RepID=A0AAW1U3W9_9CUCU